MWRKVEVFILGCIVAVVLDVAGNYAYDAVSTNTTSPPQLLQRVLSWHRTAFSPLSFLFFLTTVLVVGYGLEWLVRRYLRPGVERAGVWWQWDGSSLIPECPQHHSPVQYVEYNHNFPEVTDAVRPLKDGDVLLDLQDGYTESGLRCAATNPPHWVQGVRWNHPFRVERQDAEDYLRAHGARLGRIKD